MELSTDRPILIAGPTASGKSALALNIAESLGGIIINADALQVFDGWRVLTARPDDQDLNRAHHHLYGHVSYDAAYSVGHWLRDVAPLLKQARPIIVGGTGLYLSALTEGLAEIPPVPDTVRTLADNMDLDQMIAGLDAETLSHIDQMNRARVQRAWEVVIATGRSLASWQDDTPPPLLPLDHAHAIVLDAPKDWLTPRIEQRFDLMLDGGALEEAQAMLSHWDPAHLSSKAIGAPELIAHLKGEIGLDKARAAAVIATTQYAKRQRNWFRKRMRAWHSVHMPTLDMTSDFTFRT